MSTTTQRPTTPTEIAQGLLEQGISSTDHHATVKKAIRELINEPPSKDTYQFVKAELAEMEAQAPDPNGDFDGEAEYGDLWSKVVAVTEWAKNGKPARVQIACQDPQVNGSGESVCEKLRIIAVQDLFQVDRCAACQARHTQLKRNEMARARRARKAQK